MSFRVRILLGFGAAITIWCLAGGCAARWPATSGMVGSGLTSKVHFLSNDLADHEQVRVDRISSEWTSEGFLAVSARIRNRTSESIALLVRAVFVDRDGNPILATEDWRVFRLPARESIQFEAKGPNTHAADYRLEIRRAAEF